ncbi:MAG: hypothetical protein GY724_15780 [Actinomycetia bacterium]|nr:hypothetical protein [Actinomycetes bacterium]
MVRLATRRLVGYEQHAEDVVSRALMKWANIPADRASVARIEQVIKTEAYSTLRELGRSRARDTSYALHPAGDADPDAAARDYFVLRRAMVETCKRHNFTITTTDVELLELLMAGLTQEQAAKAMELPRHRVRRSRKLWQRVLELTNVTPALDEPASS